MRDLAILQAALALLLCLWLAAGRPPGRGDFLWRALAAWLVFAGIAIAGIWLALPLVSLLVLAELMLAATIFGAWRLRRRSVRPAGRTRTWGGRVVAALATGFALWLLIPAMAGADRPADPAAYLTFGEPVHAPCAGRVEAVEASRPDMPVPTRDRAHLEGNFVLLRCAEAMVFLGHFREGDVRVAPGQRVSTGQLLGSVGNSGNSDEPHLHIHAQTPGPADAPLAGRPLFATYDGALLVRNMVVRPAAEPASDR